MMHMLGSPDLTFELAEMAGNIIPAIATTNAIISGLVVITAIRVLDGKYAALPVEADGKTKHVKEQWKNVGSGWPMRPRVSVLIVSFLRHTSLDQAALIQIPWGPSTQSAQFVGQTS